MKNLNTKAIILGSKNIGESDKLVFLYTNELGKIKVIAKGARKITSKFTGHLETLNTCTVSLYFGKYKTIIQEIITQDIGTNSDTNFNKATGALQIAEITNQMLFENQSIEKLFELIEETKSAEHYERPRRQLHCTKTTITLYKDDIGLAYYSVLCI